MSCLILKAGIGFPASKVSSDASQLQIEIGLIFVSLYQGEGDSTEDGMTSAMNQLEGEHHKLFKET